jgi:hypothetical protein
MLGMVTEQRFCVVGKILDPDPGPVVLLEGESAVQLVVTSARLQGAGVISMETVHVGDESYTVNVFNMPATVPDRGDEFRIGPLVEGIKLTKGEALIIWVNAGWSPSVHVIVEGYKLRS